MSVRQALLITIVIAGTAALAAQPEPSFDVVSIKRNVSDDKNKTFCVYDGPNPDAIRTAAERNGLPVDRITRVSVLDPYFYR